VARTKDIAAFLKRSPAARAVLGILRSVAACGLGGMTVPACASALGRRHPASTVAHAVLALRRLGVVSWTGRWARTQQRRKAKLWRTV
jgi:hypothetical protein